MTGDGDISDFPFLQAAHGDVTPDEISADIVRRKLLQHGALILRGYDVDASSVARLASRVCDRLFTKPWYRSRTEGSGQNIHGVDKGNHEIPPHAENSFFPPERPDLGLLWVKAPTVRGGRTFVVDGCALFSSLPSDVMRVVDSLDLNWHVAVPYSDFADYYGAATREDFEALVLPKLRDQCVTDRIVLDAQCSEQVALTFRVPAVCRSRRGSAIATNFMLPTSMPKNGRGYWVDNGAVRLSPLLRMLRASAHAITVRPEWYPNDLILFDNWSVMHGREAFQVGAHREVFSCWGKADWLRPVAPC